MKVSICSDLHLEFGPITLENKDKSEVLVCAGDIVPAKVLNKDYDHHPHLQAIQANAQKFFDVACKEFKAVVWVAGNHEFYGGKWHKSLDTLKDWSLENYNNLFFLEDQNVTLNGANFYGCTLWTNQKNLDPLVMQDIEWSMNDYNQITYDSGVYRKLKSRDTVQRHQMSMMKLREFLNSNESKTVVVTHHAPSSLSSHPRYGADNSVNWAYYSSLEEDVLDFPQIALWCHGHTHDCHDYSIGNTRVVCNPRGYHGYETRAGLFQLKTVEI